MPYPSRPRKFLIIDDNADSRTFLAKALLRKYPEAVVQECQNGDTAVGIVRDERLSAVIAHRTFEYDGDTLVRLLRHASPTVAIVMVSGYDRSGIARAAGADIFMNYDAWLTIGTVVAEAMAVREKANQLGAGESSASDFAKPEMV